MITQPKRNNRPKDQLSLRKVSESLQQLSPNAVRLLREIYQMIDADGSGAVGRADLRRMIESVGLRSSDEMLDAMLAKTGEPVSCAAFLSVMSSHVGQLQPRDQLEEMLEAFGHDVDPKEVRQSLEFEGLSEPEISAFMEQFFKRNANGQQLDRKKFLDMMSI